MGLGSGRETGTETGQALFESFQSGFLESLFLAGLAALASALVVAILVSRWMVAPLRRMSLASQRIAQGRYTERVDLGRGDEIGALAASFNRMAEALQQVESRRKQLIADVAHELRTPLTTIKGSIEGLLDGMLPARAATFTQIGQEAERLTRLVDDLQELSRVEAGEFSLDCEPVVLSDLAVPIGKRFAIQYAEKGVDLRLEIPAGLPPLWADEGRLVQVLTNLLANALQHTPAGGTVRVTAEHDAGEVRIGVCDTGEGIPGEQLTRIFDRFHRVDPSRSRQSGGGSGIGLTIARYLVEAHQGRIWAESGGKDQGSSFWFTLPLKH
jgi:histidine kinase